LYHATWVIGSEVVYGYGKVHGISYDYRKKDVRLGIHVYKIEGRGVPVVGKNFAVWTMNNKLFLWKRKQAPVFLSSLKQRNVSEEKEQVKPSNLKIRQTGKIENLMKKIDFEK
jgi:hypothetical protein